MSVPAVSSFSSGVRDAAWASGYLARNPRLWRYLAWPMVIAALLTIVILGGGYWFLGGLAESLGAVLPDWLSWAELALKAIVVVTLVFAGYFVFIGLSAVLTTPFCELLSEAVETTLSGREPPPFSLRVLVRDFGLGIAHATKRLLAYLATLAALFAVSLVVPVVGGVVFAVGGIWMTVRFTSYDCLDTVWARKGWSYDRKMDYLRSRRGRAYGLGSAVAAMLAVPVVSFVAFPIGAVGATRQHLEDERGDLLPAERRRAARHLRSSSFRRWFR